MSFKLPHYEDDCGSDKILLNTLSTSSDSGEDDDDTVDREDIIRQKHAGPFWQSTCD